MRGGHRLIETLLAIGSLSTVIAGAATVDETFRSYVSGVLAQPSGAMEAAFQPIHRVTLSVVETVGAQGSTHVPAVLFAVGAGALVLLMTRA
jgi:hypothetical protein